MTTKYKKPGKSRTRKAKKLLSKTDFMKLSPSARKAVSEASKRLARKPKRN